MKKLFLYALLLSTIQFLWAQTEIKNGVVVDHGAQKIVDGAVNKLKKDLPVSFKVSYNISSDGRTTEKGTANFLSMGGRYCVTSSNFDDYCDGSTLWHYDKKTGEVEISEVEDGKALFNFVRIIDIYAKSYRPKLIRKDRLNGIGVNIVDLTPKKRSSVNKVRLWISTKDNGIVQMQVSINDGSKNTYSFSSYKAKVKTSNKDFVFPKSKYKNLKYVDLR